MCRLIIAPIIWYEEGKKKTLVLLITPIPKGNPSLQTSNEINVSLQTYSGKTITLYFTPTTKTKSKKGHNNQNFVNDYQYWTWPVYYNDISFCKLSIKSMHPCKRFWVETNINTPTKTKLKKGLNSAKIWQMTTNIKLDLYFTMIYPLANFQ